MGAWLYLPAAWISDLARRATARIPATVVFQEKWRLALTLAAIVGADYVDLTDTAAEGIPDFKTQEELDGYIEKLESDMREAAKRFEFEKAAKLRDTIKELRTKEFLFA